MVTPAKLRLTTINHGNFSTSYFLSFRKKLIPKKCHASETISVAQLS